MHWRWFSSTESLLAAKRTELQPFARQALITSRSGQWSRCSATGTVTSFVYASHNAYMASRPVIFTCLTEVWRMTGALSSSAAARTASIERSLITLIAATPYRSANARARISRVGTTATRAPPFGWDADCRDALIDVFSLRALPGRSPPPVGRSLIERNRRPATVLPGTVQHGTGVAFV